MKHIYVLKGFFDGFKGISEEEANTLIENKNAFGIEMVMYRGEGDELTITLLKQVLMPFATEKDLEDLEEEYFKYVESITGMVTNPWKKSV